MNIYLATLVYSISTIHLSHARPLDDVDGSLCQTTIKDSPTYCDSTAAGNWFIVVDASWYSDSDESTSYKKIKHYYQEQKHIAEKMIDYISEINHKEVNSDDKHEICLILATNRKIEVIKKLCEEKTADQKLPFTAEPTTDGILPEEILNEIDEQPTHCNWRPNRQRFVLYIAQHTNQGYIEQAFAKLNRWYHDPNKSIVVVFIVIAEGEYNSFITIEGDDVEVYGWLFLNPAAKSRGTSVQKYDDVKYIVGQFAVQCCCNWAEDCTTKNASITKNCHFQMEDEKELCTMTVQREVVFTPKKASLSLPSCWSNTTTRIFQCSHDQCMVDCDRKGWSEWSNCENHWNQGFSQMRLRPNETAGSSEFGTSCKKEENRKCSPPVQSATTAAVSEREPLIPYAPRFGTTTTMASQTNVSTAIWGLFFALLLLSCSIVAAAFIVIRVRRHRRRRRGHSPAARNIKGRRRDGKPDSFLSRSRMSLKLASVRVDKKQGVAASLRLKKPGRSFGGVDAVGGSSLSINEVEAPSSKIGKISKVQSSSRKPNPNFNRSLGPMGASLKVSLLENDPRSTKNDSRFGKMDSSKTSQSRTSQSKTSQSKTWKKVG